MPELPEVHTISSDLRKHVVGFTITRVWIADSYIKISDKKDFAQKVTGRMVTGVTRIAKNILVNLDDGNHLHIHLAMTGQIFLMNPDEVKGKKAHVVFQIKRDKENKILTFYDARMFGRIAYITPVELKQIEDKYGTEPIAQDINVEQLYDLLKNKKTIIKNILMDQHLISGLGNIYATEALFLAKIHPQTQMKSITFEQFAELMKSAKFVLEQGIKNRGSTLPDKTYVDIFGQEGSQQEHFNVYLQKKCPNCGTEIQYIQIGGRGTYFCPNCQRLP